MYADLNVLRARAGRLSGAWDLDTDPDEDDLERWLSECSSTLDLELGVHGVTTPVTDEQAIEVLGAMAADGALVLAIEATWPGEAPADAGAILAGAKARWEAALQGLRDGTNSVAAFLLAGGDAAEPLSTSFWIEEPTYPYPLPTSDYVYPLTRPGAYRGQGY